MDSLPLIVLRNCLSTHHLFLQESQLQVAKSPTTFGFAIQTYGLTYFRKHRTQLLHFMSINHSLLNLPQDGIDAHLQPQFLDKSSNSHDNKYWRYFYPVETSP